MKQSSLNLDIEQKHSLQIEEVVETESPISHPKQQNPRNRMTPIATYPA